MDDPSSSQNQDNLLAGPLFDLTNNQVIEIHKKSKKNQDFLDEIHRYCLEHGIQWEKCALSTIVSKVSNLKKNIKRLKYTLKKPADAEILGQKLFELPVPSKTRKREVQPSFNTSEFENDIINLVQAKVIKLEEKNNQLEKEKSSLENKLKHVPSRIKQSLKREKTAKEKYKSILSTYTTLRKPKKNEGNKLCTQIQKMTLQIRKLRARVQELKSGYICNKCSQKNHEIFHLRQQLKEIDYKYDILSENFDSLKQGRHFVETRDATGGFNDNIRLVCYKFLTADVGVNHISELIKYAAKVLCNTLILDLPEKSCLCVMQRELGRLSLIQAGQAVLKNENACLSSDGTSKKGLHYADAQVTVMENGEQKTFSCDMRRIVSGTYDNYLAAITGTFQDISKLLSKIGMGDQSSLYNKLLVSVKSAMSDRHIVEKKVSESFSELRKECFPRIIESFETLTEDEKSDFYQFYTFHCSLHTIVGLTTAADKSLTEWERQHSITSASGAKRSESATQVFIRSVCNLFFKDGGGAPGDIQAHCEMNGVAKPPLQPFSGSRFNIILYNAAGIYFLKPIITSFVQDVWAAAPTQRLRAALLVDLININLFVGCRVYGLLEKHFTGPFWRLVALKGMTLLDLNPYFEEIVKKLGDWSEDPDPLFDGSCLLIDDKPELTHRDDIVYKSLIGEKSDMEVDAMKSVLKNVKAKMEDFLVDHLPGGRYHVVSEKMRVETESVPTTNVAAERDFAQLDRFLRYAPNASVYFHKGRILSQNNKTVEWLEHLSDRSDVIKVVRTLTKNELKQEAQQRRDISASVRQKPSAAAEEKARKLAKALTRAKKQLDELQGAGGLWDTAAEVISCLNKCPEGRRKTALKQQINARKVILKQDKLSSDKVYTSLFLFSEDRKQHNWQTLRDNLLRIIELSGIYLNDTNVGGVGVSGETEKCTKIISFIELHPKVLVNQPIQHQFEANGELKWWGAKITKQITKSKTFLVKYDDDNKTYEWTLDEILDDFKNEDLLFINDILSINN